MTYPYLYLCYKLIVPSLCHTGELNILHTKSTENRTVNSFKFNYYIDIIQTLSKWQSQSSSVQWIAVTQPDITSCDTSENHSIPLGIHSCRSYLQVHDNYQRFNS